MRRLDLPLLVQVPVALLLVCASLPVLAADPVLLASRDGAGNARQRALFLDTAHSVEKSVRRWYVQQLRATGKRPTSAALTSLSVANPGLFPSFGFTPATPPKWALHATGDSRVYRLCVSMSAATVVEHDGLLEGVQRARMTRAGNSDCTGAPSNVVPRNFPATVHAFRFVDLRNIAVPTLLPAIPQVSGVPIKQSSPSVAVSAEAGKWGTPVNLSVRHPTSAEVSAMGLMPSGSTTQLGTVVPNTSVNTNLVGYSVLSPDSFRLTHNCTALVPGSACQVQIAFKGRSDGSLKPMYDGLRLEFANGAVAFVGVEGRTAAAGTLPGSGEVTTPTLPEENGGGGTSVTPPVTTQPPVVTDPATPPTTGEGSSGGSTGGSTGGSSSGGLVIPVGSANAANPALSFSARPGESTSQLVTFTNTSNAIVRVNFVPAGNMSYPFTAEPQDGCPKSNVDFQPGASCVVKVTFSPPANAATGQKYSDPDSLRVHWQYRACVVGSCNDASPGGHWAGPVTVTGTVLTPAPATPAQLVIAEGTALDLGTLARGRTYTFALTLKNSGTNALALYSFNDTGTKGVWLDPQGSISQVNVSNCSTIAGNASCQATFTVAPGSWMTTGQLRGKVVAPNGQDKATYKSVTTPTLQLVYRVGS